MLYSFKSDSMPHVQDHANVCLKAIARKKENLSLSLSISVIKIYSTIVDLDISMMLDT